MTVLREAAASGEPYDVVLANAHLLEEDGFLLASRILADASIRARVILMLRALDLHSEAMRCRDLGVAYLSYPMASAELRDSLLATAGQVRTETRPDGPPAMASRSLRVLLVEDNPVNQKLARLIIESAGHQVVVAGDGCAALEISAAQAFDLVLMDLQMPRMDGLQATRAIRERENGSSRRLPIVALTAHAMQSDREQCMEAGMDGYLTKPVRARELVEEIERFAARGAAR
jgi:CheY-like chemotaxis protein